MTVRILTGDCRDVLKTLPDASVNCGVSSPPYWGLRSYLPEGHADKHMEIGSEPTLQQWVDTMVGVFREFRRVLRPDGTLFLNLGDAYNNSDKWGGGGGNTGKQTVSADGSVPSWEATRKRKSNPAGLKPKDLMGQPWRVAFALQDDGWYLRQEIIWHKPNPMPESIKDRCTKAHEHIFLLTKSPHYYFDQDAIRTPFSQETKAQSFETMDFKARDKYKMPDGWDTGKGAHGSFHRDGREKGKRNTFARTTKSSAGEHGQKAQHRPDREAIDYGAGANKRSVWTVATEAFREAHFATFPPALIEPCVLAGCPVGGVVLDPFGGAGTTGLVADRLQRDAILIELNPAYAEMASSRITGDAPLFADVGRYLSEAA